MHILNGKDQTNIYQIKKEALILYSYDGTRASNRY